MKPAEKTFIFQGYDAQIEKGLIAFKYIIKRPQSDVSFVEKVTFPPVSPKDVPGELLTNILNNLLLIIGISYWKLYCPRNIIIEPFALTRSQASFWNIVYTKGLGEFFYRNNIDFHNAVSFPFKDTNTSPISFQRKDRSLLGIGGGKDSIVSGELLKKNKKSFSAFVVNTHPIREYIIKQLEVNTIALHRELDPLLFTMNAQKDTFNGHIPVSAQYAFLGIFSAILFNYRYVIASNEHSANYGNIFYLGEEINHQWSKSEEFERLIRSYTNDFITPDIKYFSLLRSFTEIKIVELFVEYEKYFPYFSSCNKNFKITGEGSSTLWCGNCPKCLFVFSLMGAYLSKEKLLTIFGQNLFASRSLSGLFEELLGLGEIKPFECVGTPEEVRYSVYRMHQKGEFEDTPLMKIFVKKALPKKEEIAVSESNLFSLQAHDIPTPFISLINNI